MANKDLTVIASGGDGSIEMDDGFGGACCS